MTGRRDDGVTEWQDDRMQGEWQSDRINNTMNEK